MLSSPTSLDNDSSSELTPLTLNQKRIIGLGYIKSLVEHYGDPNIKYLNGSAFLAQSIESEFFEATQFLLEQNADLNATNSMNIDCLTLLKSTSREFFAKCFDLALENQYWEIISAFLLKDFPDHRYHEMMYFMKPIDDEQNSLTENEKRNAILFYIAISKGHLKAVQFFLNHNSNINITCSNFGSPLCLAINSLHYPKAVYPNRISWSTKESANYQATNPILYEIIELLLKNKANPSEIIYILQLPDDKYFTPLTYSVFARDTKLLNLLLAYNPHLQHESPMEATAKFLCENDTLRRTPLSRAIGLKSRKMYDCLVGHCPDLLLKDKNAFSEFFKHDASYSKFMSYVLSSLPFAERGELFQPYLNDEGAAGDLTVCMAMSKNAVSMTSALLDHGANIPTVTNAKGKTRLDKAVMNKLSLPKWNSFLVSYCKELKAAEVTPSLVQMATNEVYKHTHHNEFTVKQLKGYLPQELFELYESTPQRSESRVSHFKPVIRECLEKALQPKEESVDLRQEKRAKMKA